MENKKIKKINILYLLAYIFAPVIICAICFSLSAFYFKKGDMAAILFLAPLLLSFLWWFLGGRILYKQKQKKLEKELDESGFKRDQTFYGRGCMVAVDINASSIALLFFWNPFESYVFPASRVTKAWVDDGKGGSGMMEGSSYVSFLFIVDNIKVRVYTFTSNRRWSMDSNYIVNGISKANKMVKVLETARSNAQ